MRQRERLEALTEATHQTAWALQEATGGMSWKFQEDCGDLPFGNLTWLLKMTMFIVFFPIENGDFPQQC